MAEGAGHRGGGGLCRLSACPVSVTAPKPQRLQWSRDAQPDVCIALCIHSPKTTSDFSATAAAEQGACLRQTSLHLFPTGQGVALRGSADEVKMQPVPVKPRLAAPQPS